MVILLLSNVIECIAINTPADDKANMEEIRECIN